MEAYKKSTINPDTIIEKSFEWVSTVGKQTYRFPEDVGKNEQRCHLCEKTTYNAERITYNGVPYHKDCFRCVFCKRKQSAATVSPIGDAWFSCSYHLSKVMTKGRSSSQVMSSSEKTSKRRTSTVKLTEEEINEKIEYGIQWRAESKKQVYMFKADLSGPNSRTNPRCQKCEKTVYPAEMFTYEMVPYHKACVRCLQCNRLIGPSESTPFGEKVFLCSNHYEKLIGKIDQRSRKISAGNRHKSRTFQSTEDLSQGIEWLKGGQKQTYTYVDESKTGVNFKCQLCGKTSYPAETLTYNGIPYHGACFRCLRCGKKLTAGNANPFGNCNYLCDNHYKNIVMSLGIDLASTGTSKTATTSTYIKRDLNEIDPRMYEGYNWRVKKGRQTYKYPEDFKSAGPPRCNVCSKKCYPAETVSYEGIPYHLNCMRCLRCNKRLSSANATPFGEEVFLCNIHFEQFGQGQGLPTRGGSKVEPTAQKATLTEHKEPQKKMTATMLRRQKRLAERARKQNAE